MTIQRHEILAWLGDDHGLNADQVTKLMATADQIADRYPDPDDAEDRGTALTIAYRLMQGDTAVLDELRAQLLAARIAENEALVGLQQAAITTIQQDGSETQAGFARRTTIDRMTVRKWLGLR